ncbi:hypothetical protein FOZ63_022137 [Perkinsus olseni]|uniref:PPM-type phosphatase domain-containing protein n=1 Tax=Perkinsus olseni TaxID=32597 RepID=A0A7J6UQ20_PEROL|nr:hypothetical protein FOZ63_022137 [Perkinsus olseni]
MGIIDDDGTTTNEKMISDGEPYHGGQTFNAEDDPQRPSSRMDTDDINNKSSLPPPLSSSGIGCHDDRSTIPPSDGRLRSSSSSSSHQPDAPLPGLVISHGSVEKRSSSTNSLTAIYEAIRSFNSTTGSRDDARMKKGKCRNQDAYFVVSREGLTLVGVFDGHGGTRASSSSAGAGGDGGGGLQQQQLSHYLASVVPDVFYETLSKLIPGEVNVSTLSAPVSSEADDGYGLYTKTDKGCLRRDDDDKDPSPPPSPPPAIIAALSCTLRICEERAITSADVDTANGGSTATLVCIDEASALVRERIDERQRIVSCGGVIYKNKAVGVAVTNIAITRSLGDTVMRSDGVEGRDSDFDADLVKFAKKKGCTGLIASPEWYVWSPRREHGGLYWAATNTPVQLLGIPACHHIITASTESFPSRSSGSDDSPLASSTRDIYVMVASDGLWDIISPKTVEDKIRSLGPSPTPPQVDHLIKSSCIPSAPHDDTTWVLLRIPIQTSTAGKDNNDNNEEDGEDPFDTSAIRQHWTSHSSPINRPATLSTLDALFTPQDGDQEEEEEQLLTWSQTDRGRSISSPDGFRRGGRGKHHLPPPPPSTVPAASSLDQLFAPLGGRLSSGSVAPPPPPAAATQQRNISRWGRLKHLRDHRHH